jgi:DNA-binding beta-propeller fold protein YncE
VILFINTRTGKREGDPVTVGTLPDMLTFAPSGRMVLVANEGTPNTRTPGQPYPVDPPGSVSMIDLRIARGHDAAHKPTLSGYAYPFGVGRLSNFEQERDAAQLSRLYERG